MIGQSGQLDPSQSREARWGSPTALAIGLALMGLLVTTGASAWTWRVAAKNDALRFEAACNRVWELLETRVEKHELALGGLAEWFGLVQTPSLIEWKNRMERLDVAVNHPSLVEVGYYANLRGNYEGPWAGRIPPHWPKLDLRLPAPTELMLVYLERPSPGVEVPERLLTPPDLDGETLVDAYKSAAAKTTGLAVVGTNALGPDRGFRMYVAAYRPDMESGEIPVHLSGRRPSKRLPTDRGNGLVGWVMGAFSADALITEVFGQHELDVDFDWFAGKPAETNRLNRLRGNGFSLTSEYARRLHQDLEVPWYGQRWNLRFYPSASFYGHSLRRQAWLVAIAGSALTGALTLLIFVQANGRRRAERLALDLDESRENLRIASEARSQLSRELHDGTIQSLYAIGLALRLGNRSGTLPQEVTRRLHDIGSQLDQVIADLRRYLVSSSQESASMKPQTLAAGLEELARRWKLTHPIEFQITMEPLAEPPIATTVGSLLQLMQEAISNAVRHGAASRIEITAKSEDRTLVLTVIDHGTGFEPDRLQERTVGGLANMRQRATAMGASLQVASKVGGPTTITVLLPDDSREPTR